MKIHILISFALIMTVVTYGQQKRDLKLSKSTKFIEVTYYHDNGVVSQTGAYTLDGKLQGAWLSFDTEGHKLVSANYDHGSKVGKWFYWNEDTLKEVDYTHNAIASIHEWTDSKALAVRH